MWCGWFQGFEISESIHPVSLSNDIEGVYDINTVTRKVTAHQLDNIKDIKGLISIMTLYQTRCNNIFNLLSKRKRPVKGFPYQVMLLGYNDLNLACVKCVNLAL